MRVQTQNRKQISELAMDLEVINPIESKKILGGDWYNGGGTIDYYYDTLDQVEVSGGGSSGSGWYDPWGGGNPWGGSGNPWWGNNQGGGNGDYGGNGDGSGDNGDPIHQVHCLFSENELEKQPFYTKDCVSYAIAYALAYLHEKPMNVQATMNSIASRTDLSINTLTNATLSVDDTFRAVNSVLNTHLLYSTNGIQNAIDNDHVVIANMNSIHEVAIVGYQDNRFHVYDSSLGKYEWYDSSKFNLGYGIYEVISAKP